MRRKHHRTGGHNLPFSGVRSRGPWRGRLQSRPSGTCRHESFDAETMAASRRGRSPARYGSLCRWPTPSLRRSKARLAVWATHAPTSCCGSLVGIPSCCRFVRGYAG